MGVILQAPEEMDATSLTVERSTYTVAEGQVEVDPAHVGVLEQRFGFERVVGKARAPAKGSGSAGAKRQKGAGEAKRADAGAKTAETTTPASTPTEPKAEAASKRTSRRRSTKGSGKGPGKA